MNVGIAPEPKVEVVSPSMTELLIISNELTGVRFSVLFVTA